MNKSRRNLSIPSSGLDLKQASYCRRTDATIKIFENFVRDFPIRLPTPRRSSPNRLEAATLIKGGIFDSVFHPA
jgi:hypothetical protein